MNVLHGWHGPLPTALFFITHRAAADRHDACGNMSSPGGNPRVGILPLRNDPRRPALHRRCSAAAFIHLAWLGFGGGQDLLVGAGRSSVVYAVGVLLATC